MAKRKRIKPWHRAGRGWYATVDGKQIPLGVFDQNQIQQARDALTALLAQLPENQLSDAAAPDWAARVETYLAHKAARGLKACTLAGYRRSLTSWLARFGTTPRADLTAGAVEDDAAQRPTWGRNQRRNYLAAVEAFLRWDGLDLSFDKPGRESAGADRVITEATHWQAVGSARGDLKGLLCFLWHTGCRPSEASRLTVEMVDWESETVRLREHKTRGTGRDRIIYLSPDALKVLSAQRTCHQTGLLFRSQRGTAYTMNGLTQALWRISDRIGHHVTAYGYRHSYATRALVKGLPDTHVAALLGHGSTRMIHAHYSHLNANAQLLKDAARKVG